ncbi:phage terminase large subunit [Ruegeria sp. 2205SS24-7]|uniref:phage terminase large subunit n=1 Tax=Ruegeria discodermiae TaxID=3064389 RepID=UPI0027428A00|nr:phage terminase large subunit [Ruegeria sp. 2205SS24-7]MDP5220406.1 phage terminase large subunit [Ruegeria sp. 2205SS24-7]
MSSDRAVLHAALRQKFPSFLKKAFPTVSGGEQFVENWHHNAIGHQLHRVADGENRRLIVTMPPRYLKSITISVAWVAWMLGRDPSLKFVCVSYSGDLAQKHASDCRAIMQTEWYRRIFPNTRLKRGGNSEMDFRTTKGGGRLSTSVGGTLTGRGGDIIIIDDPIKPEDAMSDTTRNRVINWFANTLMSRLNDKAKGSILLVMQRLHEEDLAGHLLGTEGWEHLCLPAIAEDDERVALRKGETHERRRGEALHQERESVADLEYLRSIMGTALFSAQYQQSPVPVEGLHVRKAWFRRYSNLPDREIGDRIVQSWDTASKDGVFSDYSVCVTALLRKRDVYILDVYREKLKFPDLRRKVIKLARRWNINALLIEDAASGQQLIQVLRENLPRGLSRPIARKPQGDKQTRFSAQSHRIEAGELWLPEEALWLAEFERELLGFPNLKHDDQVDALTQLLGWSRPNHGYRPYMPGDIPGILGPGLYIGDRRIE